MPLAGLGWGEGGGLRKDFLTCALVLSETASSTVTHPEGPSVAVRWLDWDHVYQVPGTPDEAPYCKVDASAVFGGSREDDHDQGHGSNGGAAADTASPVQAEDSFGRPVWECPPLDFLVGSDVICDESCSRGLARLIQSTLRESGTALILAPYPEHRYGVDSFPKHLKSEGTTAWKAGRTVMRPWCLSTDMVFDRHLLHRSRP